MTISPGASKKNIIVNLSKTPGVGGKVAFGLRVYVKVADDGFEVERVTTGEIGHHTEFIEPAGCTTRLRIAADDVKRAARATGHDTLVSWGLPRDVVRSHTEIMCEE